MALGLTAALSAGFLALSLYRAADERLYARKLVLGERAGRSLYSVGA